MPKNLVEARLPFTAEELQPIVIEAVGRFFNTMLGLPIQYENAKPGLSYDDLEGPPPPVLPSKKTVIVGMVGFIGAVSGVINLYLEEDLAVRLTGTMLGMTEEEVIEEGPEVINDTLGEMTNMIVGTFKNQLCDKGFDCRMTLPSILRGTNFTIETPSTVFRHIFCFKTLNAPFIADLTMKPGE